MEYNATSNIIIKSSYKGEFRRFQFSGTSFNQLHSLLLSLHQAPKDIAFEIRYRDEEEDLITISSDEELACAIEFCKTPKLLKLVLEEKKVEKTKGTEKIEVQSGEKIEVQSGVQNDCKIETRSEVRREDKGKKENLLKKKENIENFIAKLSSIPRNRGDYESRQRKIDNLKKKLKYIESRLEVEESDEDSESTNTNITNKKEEIVKMKQKINALKESIGVKKFAINEKKISLCQTTNETEKKQLSQEITELKKSIFQMQKEIREMRQIFSPNPSVKGNNNPNKEKISQLKESLNQKKSLIITKKNQIPVTTNEAEKAKLIEEIKELKKSIFNLRCELNETKQQHFQNVKKVKK